MTEEKFALVDIYFSEHFGENREILLQTVAK